jgi:alkylhydroperoxidase family enzyme
MLRDPCSARMEKRQSALLSLVAAVTERPWAMGQEYLARARAGGLGDETILHAAVLSAFFNYLNRVADAIDLEFDYDSPLPRPDRDSLREPVPRPSRQSWPTEPAFAVSLSDRAATADAFRHWRAYVSEREAPLSRRDRAVLRHAVASALCDARTMEELPGAVPRDGREEQLAAYADKLTATPWRLQEEDLSALRRLGLDDRGLLDVISVSSFQNTASRLRLVLRA